LCLVMRWCLHVESPQVLVVVEVAPLLASLWPPANIHDGCGEAQKLKNLQMTRIWYRSIMPFNCWFSLKADIKQEKNARIPSNQNCVNNTVWQTGHQWCTCAQNMDRCRNFTRKRRLKQCIKIPHRIA
jgi:hypothetical protein